MPLSLSALTAWWWRICSHGNGYIHSFEVALSWVSCNAFTTMEWNDGLFKPSCGGINRQLKETGEKKPPEWCYSLYSICAQTQGTKCHEEHRERARLTSYSGLRHTSSIKSFMFRNYNLTDLITKPCMIYMQPTSRDIKSVIISSCSRSHLTLTVDFSSFCFNTQCSCQSLEEDYSFLQRWFLPPSKLQTPLWLLLSNGKTPLSLVHDT